VRDIIVHQVVWKRLTNEEIRRASTRSPAIRSQPSRNDFVFGVSKAPEDQPHPWIMISFSEGDRHFLLAFSRNSSKNGCNLSIEDRDYLGLPFEWLTHKHDWHDCRVLNLCGKVNFSLQKKRDWPTHLPMPSAQAFISANNKPVCTEDDLDLLASVIQSSKLVTRLTPQLQQAPSVDFLNSLNSRSKRDW
jgi:hypothetical protein